MSYWPGEVYDSTTGKLWSVDSDGKRVCTIPYNQSCNRCGGLTWRLDRGGDDRFWGSGGYLCSDCVSELRLPDWRAFRTLDGKAEWNARTMGMCLDKLEANRIYTLAELIKDHGLYFMFGATTGGRPLKPSDKLRYVVEPFA